MGFVQDTQTSDSVGSADAEGHRAAHDRALADYAVGGQPPPPHSTHSALPALPPAMMPGKGVRAVRCVGCREDTLPRPEDSAPLCQRCSDVLASSDSPETWTAWTAGLAPRWLRKRSVYF